jgi:serine/threonine-protein kinase
VFALQDEIAAAVVDALKLRLLPGQVPAAGRQVDPAAYEQYLIGRKLAREQSLDGWAKAIPAYRKALQIDPNYALAQAGLADLLYETSYFNDSAETVIARQEEALQVAESAVRGQPDLAEGYRVRARMRSEIHFDVAGAMADIRRALELSPNDADVLAEAARLFTVSRRFDEAQAVVDKAVDLDPLATDALLSKAELYTARNEWAGAREYYQRILDIAPDSNYASSGLVQSWLSDGNPQAAAEVIRSRKTDARGLYSQALVEHALGHRAESERALQQLIGKYAAGWAYQIAVVYAWRGEKDKAFEWLERAWRQHDGGLLRLQTEPMLAPLWKDPRYPALRTKEGFTD